MFPLFPQFHFRRVFLFIFSDLICEKADDHLLIHQCVKYTANSVICFGPIDIRYYQKYQQHFPNLLKFGILKHLQYILL